MWKNRLALEKLSWLKKRLIIYNAIKTRLQLHHGYKTFYKNMLPFGQIFDFFTNFFGKTGENWDFLSNSDFTVLQKITKKILKKYNKKTLN